MNNITTKFDDVYLPVKALVIYQNQQPEGEVYIEAYDMDGRGCPINAHPLDVQESAVLARALDSSEELQREFLKPKKLLSDNILYINPSYDGCVIWYTPAREVDLFFVPELGIPTGKAKVPALLWKADKERLHIYALKTSKKPNEKTQLHYAPFFNIYEDGEVCMGTVNIEIASKTCLEDFISRWEHYFFSSYFSHLIGGHSPIESNIVQLWQNQVNSHQGFPTEVLKMRSQTIKDIIR
jgi:PRTRC genetic system protein B